MNGLPPIRLVWTKIPAGASRRATAWQLLRDEIDEPGIRITNPCPRCGGPHGGVRIEGAPVTASVAYAAGLAIVAIAPATGRVGVDAEPERDRTRDAAGLHGVLGPGSTPSVRDWVRVEAALKADGRGLRVDPAAVAITVRDRLPAPADADAPQWVARIPGGACEILGTDLDGPAGVLVSAAIVAD